MGKDIASEQWRSLPGTKPVSVLGALFLPSPTLGGVNGDVTPFPGSSFPVESGIAIRSDNNTVFGFALFFFFLIVKRKNNFSS